MNTTNLTETELKTWPWRTVIIGGERGGGDTYFAIDVTDPYQPVVLWEYSVLKNMIAKFNMSDAVTSFMSGCLGGTTTLSPGFTATPPCNGPTVACSACSTSSACLTYLNGLGLANSVWRPFADTTTYNLLKEYPMSWSRPAMGRVGLPQGYSPNVCAPTGATGTNHTCSPPTSCAGTVTGIRNLVFTGGGLRVTDPGITLFPSTWTSQGFYQDGFRRSLISPFFLALDIETGVNVFQYVWPDVLQATQTLFPDEFMGCDTNGLNCATRIPYSMSDPIVLDLWDRTNNQIGDDGYADTIYVGDMNGLLYGIKINMSVSGVLSADTGFYIDIWNTKPIPANTTTTQDLASNIYRSDHQPLTVEPSASLERTGTNPQGLRVVIAGGKHEDVIGNKTDATDVAKMSLYNLRDSIYLPTNSNFTQLSGTTLIKGSCADAGNINYWVRRNCATNTFRCTGSSSDSGCSYSVNDATDDSGNSTSGTGTQSGCRWSIPGSNNTVTPDCCESNCSNTNPAPCWSCIYDLQQTGEKVINKPLIAGGVVFFTSFVPISSASDVCGVGGSGYLYAFDYMCQAFPLGFNPIPAGTNMVTLPAGSGSSSATPMYGVKVDLGLGVPSQPVLDSTGKYVIVQTSSGQLSRVGVNLLTPPANLQGWKESN